jgi:hypothetical protein
MLGTRQCTRPQHVLSHALDVRTVRTSRLVSKAWHAAVHGAAAVVECSIPGSAPAAADRKLAHLRAVAPCLTELRLNIGPDAVPELLVSLMQGVAEFKSLGCADWAGC